MPGKRSGVSSDSSSTQSSPKAARGRKRKSVERDVNGANGTPTKKIKVSHSSHCTERGWVLALGEGDTGQLGLGEDVMERMKPGKVDLPGDFVQVVAGGMHTACLTADGKVYTFGCNDDHALGRDTSEEGTETIPGLVDFKEKFIQISAGDSHTAALTDDGRVFAWGTFRDANGIIGLTKEGNHKTPVVIFNDQTVVKIVSGSDHIVCLTNDGHLYTMGNAEQGQLGRVAECFANRGGRKGIEFLLTPAAVHCKRVRGRGKAIFKDCWAGTYTTYAVDRDSGDVYGWGLNNYYQLGISDMVNRYTPERITSFHSDKGWVGIASGQHHTLALDKQGQVYSLGRSTYGRLGLGDDAVETAEPTLIPALNGCKCVQIDAGSSVSAALAEDGTIYTWGMGSCKQLGHGDEEDVSVPTKMGGKQLETRNGLMVSVGGQHTVVLAKDK